MTRFDSEKKSVLEEYAKSLRTQKIDSRVIPVLKLINTHNDYYTTSSCSGRVMLLALEAPGTKNESIILGKWHDRVNKEQFEVCMSAWNKFKFLYFLAQSPIFHVIARDIKSAVRLRNLGVQAGFKYSSIRSVKPIKRSKNGSKSENKVDDEEFKDARFTVELLSTERLNIPIGGDGRIFIDYEYQNFILELANNSLFESNKKVKKLEKILKNL